MGFMRCARLGYLLLLLWPLTAWPYERVKLARVKDVATVEGVRDNQLVGYGIVVGLRGTGDSQQTVFPLQTLVSTLQRMGVNMQQSPQLSQMRTQNMAAVFISATLPAFARPGNKIDVTVSSAGDARSLEGGMLLLTPLYGADGQVYAAAQGALTLGGYSAGAAGNAKEVNHPTVGRIPGGGLVERDASIDLEKMTVLTILLSEPNFSTAERVAAA